MNMNHLLDQYLVILALSFALVLALGAAPLRADSSAAGEFTRVASGVEYLEIGTYDIARLNQILTTEREAFSGSGQEFPPARFPVKLYRVLYRSVIPERNNRPTTASGLVAIPVVAQGDAALPVVSYQHGTTFGKNEAPSHPEESYETRLMIAQYAGQGYVVIGADYFGKGESAEPDSYTVKASTQQACLDMLYASRDVCGALGVEQGPLFVFGWSQGGLSTMAFLRKLESVGVDVAAASTASAFNDMFATVNRWIHLPDECDKTWLPGIFALNLQAYAAYYDLPGLVSTAIQPDYQQAARDLFEKRISWQQFHERTPGTLREFLQTGFRESSLTGEDRYWRIVLENEVYRWRSKTPLRTYYGDLDEFCPPYIARLPVAFQEQVGGGETTAVAAGPKADHRGTFLHAVADQKPWFDSFVEGKGGR